MGTRLGALAVATLVALLAGCSPEVNYANGTYTFVTYANDSVDTSRVLVQSGVVTDVWISNAAAEGLHYGYTPLSPADMFYEGNHTAVRPGGDQSLTLCDTFDGGGEQCNSFGDVNAQTPGEARRASDWDGLEDGAYKVTYRNVWWEGSDTVQGEITNGVLTLSSPDSSQVDGLANDEWLTAHGDWVRYWVTGATEPFAVCYDISNGSDEETCYTWTALDG